MADKKKPVNKWVYTIFLLVALFIAASISASMLSLSGDDLISYGNVALIKVDGVIMAESGQSPLGMETISSDKLIGYLEDAEENPGVKAILVQINSPGGSAVASKEVADAVKRSEKPTYAVIREIGASGGYWIASACDMIIANELSVTGSIGVISSYLEFSKLFDKYGITYERLVAGKYKDMGSPFRNISAGEKMILQSKIDKIYDVFVAEVAENRNMTYDRVNQLAEGMFYIGIEAKSLGLVDELGDMQYAEDFIKEQLNLTEVTYAEYREPVGFFEALAGVFSEQSYHVGEGIGRSLATADLNSQYKMIT